jgi:hypothetical protein
MMCCHQAAVGDLSERNMCRWAACRFCCGDWLLCGCGCGCCDRGCCGKLAWHVICTNFPEFKVQVALTSGPWQWNICRCESDGLQDVSALLLYCSSSWGRGFRGPCFLHLAERSLGTWHRPQKQLTHVSIKLLTASGCVRPAWGDLCQ